jgi:hypothetical protein
LVHLPKKSAKQFSVTSIRTIPWINAKNYVVQWTYIFVALFASALECNFATLLWKESSICIRFNDLHIHTGCSTDGVHTVHLRANHGVVCICCFIITAICCKYVLLVSYLMKFHLQVSQSNLRDLLLQCCMDDAYDVRQSAFALLGDLARVSWNCILLLTESNFHPSP